jgi:hypothetical protein
MIVQKQTAMFVDALRFSINSGLVAISSHVIIVSINGGAPSCEMGKAFWP